MNTSTPRNPFPTVDIIIYNPINDSIVLVKRRFEPLGWALPGGFVDYGESVETAARREALEETSLDVKLLGLVGVYSSPNRDLRKHTMSNVFWGIAKNIDQLMAGDDAGEAVFYKLSSLPKGIVFDHPQIIEDFKLKLEKLSL